MQFIGIILFVFSCIGMIGGFIYGDSNFGGYSYEFSLALAWGWWSSALVLLALSGICFSLPPKQGDDPRFPRFRDELNYDYWERVKRATQNK